MLPFKVGHSLDLYRLEPRLPLIIGGIKIPYEKGCHAHFNGNVLIHYVVDAILGALGLPIFITLPIKQLLHRVFCTRFYFL